MGPTCHNTVPFPDTSAIRHHFNSLIISWNSNTSMKKEARCILLCKPGATASRGRLKNDNWDRPNSMPVAAHMSLPCSDNKVAKGTAPPFPAMSRTESIKLKISLIFCGGIESRLVVESNVKPSKVMTRSGPSLLVIFSMNPTISKTRSPTWNTSRPWGQESCQMLKIVDVNFGCSISGVLSRR